VAAFSFDATPTAVRPDKVEPDIEVAITVMKSSRSGDAARFQATVGEAG
jgi:hypothetical protein